MRLIRPLDEIEMSEIKGVWFCECCDRAFKKKSYYVSHIRGKKLNKIINRI